MKRKIVKFLEVDEVRKLQEPLLQNAKTAINDKNCNKKLTVVDKIAIRDFALISLVYACALRISEACNLKLDEVDFEKLEVSIFDGKGGDRIVPLPQPTVKILKEWLEIRPQWKGNNYFFVNVKGTTRPGEVRPLATRYYEKLFEKLADISGVKLKNGAKPHPHTLRHSRAMEIYDNIQQLDILQALLGHKNITTTQIYAQVRSEKVNKVQQTITEGLVTI